MPPTSDHSSIGVTRVYLCIRFPSGNLPQHALLGYVLYSVEVYADSSVQCCRCGSYDNVSVACGSTPWSTKCSAPQPVRLICPVALIVGKITRLPSNLLTVYISPNSNFNISSLHSTLKSYFDPFLVCGDFNAHNSLWGSDRSDTRGRYLEKVFTT